MNRDFIRHLLAARRHLRDAAISLAPPRARDHLKVIDHEWRQLIAECLTGPRSDVDARPRSPRRIDIEE